MKYEIGSLVMLSSQGAKLGQNSEERGGFGIVVKHVLGTDYPYKMKWFYKGKNRPFSSPSHSLWDFGAKEYEIKKMRSK